MFYWNDATDPSNPLCSPCDSSCLWCGTSAIDCTGCDPAASPDPLYLNSVAHTCGDACPAGTWAKAGPPPICEACNSPCAECAGGPDVCTVCLHVDNAAPDVHLEGDSCVETCTAGSFKDITTPAAPVCSPCTSPCATCTPDATTCTKCVYPDGGT